MKITAIATHKITGKDNDLLRILDKYLNIVVEGSVVVITSKIVAVTQGRIARVSRSGMDALVKKEANYYIDKNLHKSKMYITLKDNSLTFSSGIDDSNGNGHIVLWPDNVQVVANIARKWLCKKFKLKKLGVIITDMTALPLKWGVIAGALAYSGFSPLNDLRGKPDVFGRKMKFTQAGILNGLAAAAGVVMGEGNEQTPLAIINDIPFVRFVSRNPFKKELDALIIEPDQDMYGPLFKGAPWQKGGAL